MANGSQALGTWTEERVGGHPCDLYEPPQRNPHGFVLVYLHGVHLQRLRDHEAYVRELARLGLPLVAPVTQRSWWTDRRCLEFDPERSAERHVLDQVLPFVRERFAAVPPRIGLFGTSMGGQGALRFAYKHPHLFPVVAAVSPAIDYQSRYREGDPVIRAMYRDEEDVRQDTATLHVHPLNWPRHQFLCCDPEDERWFESADRLHMKLYSLGIPHETEFDVSAGGHGFGYYDVMAPRVIAFLAERLERERLRL